MPALKNVDTVVWIFAIIAGIIFLVILLVGLCSFISDFSAQLKQINNEIRRTSGAERQYYLRKKRRLWLSLIPFVKP